MNRIHPIRRRPIGAAVLIVLAIAGCSGNAVTSPSARPAVLTVAPTPTSTAEVDDTPEPTVAPAADLRPGLKVAWTAGGREFAPHVQTTGMSRLSSGEYLVFGSALTINGVTTMAASSTDGRTWKPAGSGLDPVPGLTLVAAALRPAVGTVAVGTVLTNDAATGSVPARAGVVYLRRPGEGWTRAADQASLKGAEIRGVIATADRFVAFGLRADGPAIWSSTDGLRWAAVLTQTGTAADPISVDGVVAGYAGLLAYGARGSHATGLWRSIDGAMWTEIGPSGLDGILVTGIVSTTNGFVGVAGYPEPGPTVFRSPDGSHWAPTSAQGPSLNGIVQVENGFVAWNNTVGSTNELVMGAHGVWTSLDAVTWIHVNQYEEFYSGGMLVEDRTLISIGSANDANPIWIGAISLTPAG